LYVTFTAVDLDPAKWDTDAAIRMLETQLIPGLKQAPGFVKGTWFGNEHAGHGLVMFETQEQASGALQEIGSTVLDGIDVVSSNVYEVHTEA